MGKLGVGVGDEFPLEDGKPKASGSSGPETPPDPEFDKQREEYRKARDAYREQRRKMRDAWRARRQAYREEVRARYGDAYADDHHHWGFGSHFGYGPNRFLHILLILGLIMLGIAIFSHIYILFGLVVLAGLYYAYRGGFDHFDFREPPHSATPPNPASPPGAAS